MARKGATLQCRGEKEVADERVQEERA